MKRTTQTTTTTCDRCHEFAEGLKPKGFGVVTIDIPSLVPMRTFDLCPGCLVLVGRTVAPLDPT